MEEIHSDVQPPDAMLWSPDQVADWVEQIGYPQYRECFVCNFVDGKKLILVTPSTLPRMGITDFTHVKHIASSIRDLLNVDEEKWGRSITLPPRDPLGLFLEQKSQKGKTSDALSYPEFVQGFADMKWGPPLSNQCLLQPHD